MRIKKKRMFSRTSKSHDLYLLTSAVVSIPDVVIVAGTVVRARSVGTDGVNIANLR